MNFCEAEYGENCKNSLWRDYGSEFVRTIGIKEEIDSYRMPNQTLDEFKAVLKSQNDKRLTAVYAKKVYYEYRDVIPLTCDEYPFWSTKEGTKNVTGGKSKVSKNKVSIRYVISPEQSLKPHLTQAGMMNSFYAKCLNKGKIKPEDKNKFTVKIIPNNERSSYGVWWKEVTARNGKKEQRKIYCIGLNATN